MNNRGGIMMLMMFLRIVINEETTSLNEETTNVNELMVSSFTLGDHRCE